MTITVSTDGSALGNPNGPMGWAWADHAANAARTTGHQHDGDSDAGGATNGTNQIGELCAVLEALRTHRGTEPLTIETDSQYAINCSTKWVHGWKKNGWKNSQKKPVKNAPLIKAIDAEISHREGPVKFVWVKGHNGNPGNEKVDDLAHTYSGDARSGVKDGYLPLEGWQSLLASAYAKGVDIPADAKMLIAGKITEEQYHLGRGANSEDNDNDDWDDEDDYNENHSAQRLSLAERLTEPEDVPEYDFGSRKPIVAHHQAAENNEPSVKNTHADVDGLNGLDESDRSNGSGEMDRSAITDNSSNPNASEAHDNSETSIGSDTFDRYINLDDSIEPVDSANSDEPEEASNPDDSATTTTSDSSSESDTSTDSNKTDDLSDSNELDEENTLAATSRSDNSNSSEQTDVNKPNNLDKTANTDNIDGDHSEASHQSQHAKPEPHPQPTYLPSGLAVNGTLYFSPAPRTSPTFDGKPRRIRGVIAIDGYVAGDGEIILNGAPFLIANNTQDRR